MVCTETVNLIERILASDNSITLQEKENIMKACKQKVRKTMITFESPIKLHYSQTQIWCLKTV